MEYSSLAFSAVVWHFSGCVVQSQFLVQLSWHSDCRGSGADSFHNLVCSDATIDKQ